MSQEMVEFLMVAWDFPKMWDRGASQFCPSQTQMTDTEILESGQGRPRKEEGFAPGHQEG